LSSTTGPASHTFLSLPSCDTRALLSFLHDALPIFTPEQSRAVLEAGLGAGLDPKIHADELSDLGGAALAADLEAISADHLLCASDDGLRAMADAGTMAVLLPGTALFLGLPYARGRRMVELGVPVALGTDFNPGTSPTWSMPMVIALACLGMR